MSRKQKTERPVGCFGQIENIKRQSIFQVIYLEERTLYVRINCYIGVGIVSLTGIASIPMPRKRELNTTSRRYWSKEELVITLSLYFQLPFGRLNHTTPEVKELARLIGRSDNSVAMRLSNFASCDPYIINSGRTGLPGGLSICGPIWDEYVNDKERLFYEAKQIRASYLNQSLERQLNLTKRDFVGKDRLAAIKPRVNQDVFRTMILNNYNSRCAITGLDIQSLLVASHIIPWADNETERLNPENGICLSPLYDKAFDKGLITIQPDYEIVLSRELKEHSKEDFFKQSFLTVEHQRIILPEEHMPRPDFLQYHFDHIFAAYN